MQSSNPETLAESTQTVPAETGQLLKRTVSRCPLCHASCPAEVRHLPGGFYALRRPDFLPVIDAHDDQHPLPGPVAEQPEDVFPAPLARRGLPHGLRVEEVPLHRRVECGLTCAACVMIPLGA